MTFDWIQLAIAGVAAVAGFLARGRSPQPTPQPAPTPNQFPLLELILKLLAERFRVPLPGQPLPPEALHTQPEPTWAQQLLTEIRALRKGP